MPEKRFCRRCKTYKLLTVEMFPPKYLPSLVPGFVCSPCLTEKAQRLKPDRRLLHREHLERSYGLPPGRYEEMLAAQKHACAICQRHEDVLPEGRYRRPKLAIDHSHATGQVRGLLCTSCNWALGRFHDSIPMLRRAIKYLRDYPDIGVTNQLVLFQQACPTPVFVPVATDTKPPKKPKPHPIPPLPPEAILPSHNGFPLGLTDELLEDDSEEARLLRIAIVTKVVETIRYHKATQPSHPKEAQSKIRAKESNPPLTRRQRVAQAMRHQRALAKQGL